MATPVITNVSVVYPAGKTSVAPGEIAQIFVTASDPDTRLVRVDLVVTDQAGVSGTGSVDIVVTDPLTYSATAPSGTVSSVSPGVFSFTP